MRASVALRRAWALIENPANWCKGDLQDEAGRLCAVGALGRATGTRVMDYAAARVYLSQAADVVWPGSVEMRHPVALNDKRTHRHVRRMYTLAISMALSDETSR